MSINRGEDEKQALKGSFCLKKTRGRILLLYISFLFIAAGIVCIISSLYSYANLSADRGAFEYIVSTAIFVIGIGCIVMAVYEGYSNVRDFFFPLKSRLADSIRSQLDFPDEYPTLPELFGLVDDDIRENGRWFDSTAVGKEWVLCDDAFYIPRIRAVFKRDEEIKRRIKQRIQTVRVTELYILDDRRQQMVIPVKNHNELEPLAACLRLSAPDALFLPYEKYMTHLSMTDEDWEQIDREFHSRKSERELNKRRKSDSQGQKMTLFCSDNFVTSRVTQQLLSQRLKDFFKSDLGGWLLMTPDSSIEIGGVLFCQLQCQIVPVENAEQLDERELLSRGIVRLLLKNEPETNDAPLTDGILLETDGVTCERILIHWLAKESFDTKDWIPVTLERRNNEPREQKRRIKLYVTEKNGLEHDYHNILRADVELAGKKIVDGSYSATELDMDNNYLLIQNGDSADGRATVQTSGIKKGKVVAYEIKCRPRQAEEWLLQFYDGTFSPDLSEWKDITKKLDKLAKKLAK